jgi:hypothetical protein
MTVRLKYKIEVKFINVRNLVSAASVSFRITESKNWRKVEMSNTKCLTETTRWQWKRE